MQIKTIVINTIHYINFITFNISTFFFLICPAEIWVRLIHLGVLYAVKYSNSFQREKMTIFLIQTSFEFVILWTLLLMKKINSRVKLSLLSEIILFCWEGNFKVKAELRKTGTEIGYV